MLGINPLARTLESKPGVWRIWRVYKNKKNSIGMIFLSVLAKIMKFTMYSKLIYLTFIHTRTTGFIHTIRTERRMLYFIITVYILSLTRGIHFIFRYIVFTNLVVLFACQLSNDEIFISVRVCR